MNSYIKNISAIALGSGQKISDIGLINGKMGLCINLYTLGKYTRQELLLFYADSLIDEIYSSVNKQTPKHFADGLAGLGWGIEHLVQNGFIQADTNAVLSEIDEILFFQKSFATKNVRLDLFEGFLGLGYYFVKRLQNPNATDDSLSTLLLKQHLIGIIEMLGMFKNHAHDISREPDGIAKYWTLPMVILFLCDVHRLDIYNSRVNKIIDWLLKAIADNIPDRQFSKLLLSFAVKKLGGLEIDKKAESIYTTLSKIDRERLILEIQESKKNYLGNAINVLSIYSYLMDIGETQLVSGDYMFWQETVFDQILSSSNHFNPETVVEQAKSLGVLDGFIGFHHILPVFTQVVATKHQLSRQS